MPRMDNTALQPTPAPGLFLHRWNDGIIEFNQVGGGSDYGDWASTQRLTFKTHSARPGSSSIQV